MKNIYEIRGEEVWIEVKHRGVAMWTIISLEHLPIAMALRGTWYANPARKSDRKYYVNGKDYQFGGLGGGLSKTVLLHRWVCGNPKYEVHHIDNDGLNNRRGNLEHMTHIENIREHWPERDWSVNDEQKVLAEEYRKERVIAKQVEEEFRLTRQSLWNIRRGALRGHTDTNGRDARDKYAALIKEAGIRTLEELKRDLPRTPERAVKFGVGVNADITLGHKQGW